VTLAEQESALEQAVAEAKQRENELAAKLARVGPEWERIQAPLHEYLEGVGAGGPEDPELEAQLRADIAEARGNLDFIEEAVNYHAGTFDLRTVPKDRELEALHRGAVTARENAEQALVEFTRANLTRLEIEDLPEAQREAAEGTEVLQAARRLIVSWERRRAVRAKRAVRADRAALLGQIPENPYAWSREAPPQAPLCLAEPFWPREGQA
jgi:predicted  nucleic acid-binding Zn-ribbon protein